MLEKIIIGALVGFAAGQAASLMYKGTKALKVSKKVETRATVGDSEIYIDHADSIKKRLRKQAIFLLLLGSMELAAVSIVGPKALVDFGHVSLISVFTGAITTFVLQKKLERKRSIVWLYDDIINAIDIINGMGGIKYE